VEGDQFDLRSADVFCLASILSLWLVVAGKRRAVHLAYQPPVNSTFLSQQISH
jgi:hypothetical protein